MPPEPAQRVIRPRVPLDNTADLALPAPRGSVCPAPLSQPTLSLLLLEARLTKMRVPGSVLLDFTVVADPASVARVIAVRWASFVDLAQK